MRALIDDLHAHGQHYVMITDPGISSTQQRGSYPPLDQGISNDVFINISGKPLIGKVWPGEFVLWSEVLPSPMFAFCSGIRSFFLIVAFDSVPYLSSCFVIFSKVWCIIRISLDPARRSGGRIRFHRFMTNLALMACGEFEALESYFLHALILEVISNVF
jgi:hypothetical protein